MIRNPNYRPQYGFLEEVDAVKMAQAKYIHPHDPEYIAPEAYCPTCEDYTTLITARGECKACGTEAKEGPK
jgi:hypothetical protein